MPGISAMAPILGVDPVAYPQSCSVWRPLSTITKPVWQIRTTLLGVPCAVNRRSSRYYLHSMILLLCCTCAFAADDGGVATTGAAATTCCSLNLSGNCSSAVGIRTLSPGLITSGLVINLLALKNTHVCCASVCQQLPKVYRLAGSQPV